MAHSKDVSNRQSAEKSRANANHVSKGATSLPAVPITEKKEDAEPILLKALPDKISESASTDSGQPPVTQKNEANGKFIPTQSNTGKTEITKTDAKPVQSKFVPVNLSVNTSANQGASQGARNIASIGKFIPSQSGPGKTEEKKEEAEPLQLKFAPGKLSAAAAADPGQPPSAQNNEGHGKSVVTGPFNINHALSSNSAGNEDTSQLIQFNFPDSPVSARDTINREPFKPLQKKPVDNLMSEPAETVVQAVDAAASAPVVPNATDAKKKKEEEEKKAAENRKKNEGELQLFIDKKINPDVTEWANTKPTGIEEGYYGKEMTVAISCEAEAKKAIIAYDLKKAVANLNRAIFTISGKLGGMSKAPRRLRICKEWLETLTNMKMLITKMIKQIEFYRKVLKVTW